MKALEFKLILATLIGIMTLLPAGEAAASSTLVRVSAQVMPMVILTADQHVLTYRVEKADLQRGYLDLHQAMTVHLKTNVRREITIALITAGDERIMVKESGTARFAEASITLNPERYDANEPISRQVDYRVMLNDSTAEGMHTLQVNLTPAL